MSREGVGPLAALMDRLQQDPAFLSALGPEFTPDSLAGAMAELEQLRSSSSGSGSGVGQSSSTAAGDPALEQALAMQRQAQALLAGQQSAAQAGVVPTQLEGSFLASLSGGGAPSVSAAAAAAVGGANLAGLHNGNADAAFPDATATASNLLASGAVPAAGVSSASLEGGLLAGLGMGGAAVGGLVPSVPSWSLLASRGPFGSMRGVLMLVCAFLPGSSSVAQVSFVEEVVSGGEVRRVSRTILSIDKVLESCPSLSHYAPMADAWCFSALQRKYLLVQEVPSYAVFVARMRDAFVVLSDVAGPAQQVEAMRAFLALDRRLRVAQHSSGAPWHLAFKDAELCRALVSLQLRMASLPPSLVPRRGGSKGAGGSKGGKVRCFKWESSKESPPACPNSFIHCYTNGAACPYAVGHKCKECGSVEHVPSACPRAGVTPNVMA